MEKRADIWSAVAESEEKSGEVSTMSMGVTTDNRGGPQYGAEEQKEQERINTSVLNWRVLLVEFLTLYTLILIIFPSA